MERACLLLGRTSRIILAMTLFVNKSNVVTTSQHAYFSFFRDAGSRQRRTDLAVEESHRTASCSFVVNMACGVHIVALTAN